MVSQYLEVRHFKKQKKHYPPEYYSRCRNPQYTQYCNGLYVKTRVDQYECVACMHIHNTIDDHPLLPFLLTDCDILIV